jgi:hypothetical protein
MPWAALDLMFPLYAAFLRCIFFILPNIFGAKASIFGKQKFGTRVGGPLKSFFLFFSRTL